MSSTSEVGNAKNVANMNVLIASCSANAERYKPSNKDILPDALSALYTKADNAVTAVNTLLPASKKANATRKLTFAPLSKMITRIFNAVKSSGASKPIVSNVATIKRKLQGIRVTPRLTEEQKAQNKLAGNVKVEHSQSQTSFDLIISNFDAFVKLVASIPEYNPNEADLKVTALQTLLANLIKVNKDVVDAASPLYNARTDRDAIMNTEKTGLVDICLTTKAYIKSVDGANGRWYKQIAGLEFKRAKP